MSEGKQCSESGKVRNRKKGARLTLSEASRLLRKRISVSRQLLAAGQLWKQSLPCHDCDVVITFPPSATEETLVWILTQLKTRVPELLVEVRHHRHTNVYGFYLTTSYENQLRGAEEARLRKPLKAEFGSGMKEFVLDEQECFDSVDNKDTFISSQERQSIILNLLYSLQASEGDQLSHIKFVEGQPIIPKCLAEGLVSQVLPLHNNEDLSKLKKSWVQAFLKPQPLNDICHYFGVKIAIYFAWLGHYTKALTIPAFFGLFMWLYYYGKDQATEDLCFVVFALFNVLWATLYLESWKRDCAELAYHWGTLDSQNELLAEPRPLFTGPLAKSPVTGRMEPTYPSWKRNLFRYCVSLPVIIFCLFAVFLVMFLIFELQTWWDRKIVSQGFPFWMTLLPKILLALVINVLDGVYHKIAVWLNDMADMVPISDEHKNYRGEEEYENHLVVKELLFQFVNSFLSLFYIAFYLQDMEKLKEQLAALLITRQVVGNIKESLIPFLTETFKLAHLGADHNIPASSPEDTRTDCDTDRDSDRMSSPSGSPIRGKSDTKIHHSNLTQAEGESAMYKYEGTFEDYLEMFIQFGYVILFSSAFPMAALCALMNNVIEIRSDAFKLCMIFQRPFGQRAENIGTWQDAMEVMGVIAVIVNCALIGMSGQVQRMFPNLSPSGTIVLIVVLEHIILSIKFGIAYAIPDVPQWVATKMAKVEFQRREAVKHFHKKSLSKKKSMLERQESKSTSSSPSSQAITKSNTCEVNKKDTGCQTYLQGTPKVEGIPTFGLEKKRSVTFNSRTASSDLSSSSPSTKVRTDEDVAKYDTESAASLLTLSISNSSVYNDAIGDLNFDPNVTVAVQHVCDISRKESLDFGKPQSSKHLFVIERDLDAVSNSFETPYAVNSKSEKKLSRKLSLPQIKLLKKNSSQESDSPPTSAPASSATKKFFHLNSGPYHALKFFPSLKRKRHTLKRALSFSSPPTCDDSVKSQNVTQSAKTEVPSSSPTRQQTV